MVDFLANLPQLFRERYLDTHENYLKSIADLAHHLYSLTTDGCELLVEKLLSAGKFSESMKDNNFESIYFRNLRNAWYHELVLNYPQDDFDLRIKFAPWKIIQCYYCVIAGISALIRCFNSTEFKKHDTISTIFTNDFLNNNNRRNFFLPPYNYYLDQNGKFKASNREVITWSHGRDNCIPVIKNCLESVQKSNKRTSIPHYLIQLRNWVQYEDAYLFFQLYGETVKNNLDFSLSTISYGYMVHVEFFFIKLFGWNTLELQFDTFIKKVFKNLEIEPMELLQRYKIYEKILQ